MRRFTLLLIVATALMHAVGCAAMDKRQPTTYPTGKFAIAIHGGAGTMSQLATPEEKQRYREHLAAALTIGRDELARGGTALDAVEKVVRQLEDDELFNAGKGAVYNAVGKHELDASIMDGSTLACGAVAGVTTVKNPISFARLVMEKSGHVLLMGEGAEAFATQMNVPRVDNSYFDTPKRLEDLKLKLENDRKGLPSTQQTKHGTVGAVALDVHCNLAAATSTGGMTGKKFGRVGDSPIIGAGTYADNKSCAVSCTGAGEEFIRHTVARDIASLMEYKGLSLRDAADEVVNHKLKKGDGGIIAVDRAGDIVMTFNTAGMYRGAADSGGRFEVGIFEKD